MNCLVEWAVYTESILHRMLFFVTSDGQHLSSPLPLERGEEVTTELVDSRLQYQLRDLTSIFVSLWNWLLLLWTPSLPPQLDSPSWAFLPFRSQPVVCWLHSDPTDGSLLKIAVIIIIYILIRWPSPILVVLLLISLSQHIKCTYFKVSFFCWNIFVK